MSIWVLYRKKKKINRKPKLSLQLGVAGEFRCDVDVSFSRR